ncbi:MAG TPA: hypothetical protein VF944_11620 [Candidatus Bathyarchaeia archaeon]
MTEPPRTLPEYLNWLRRERQVAGVDLQSPGYLKVAERIRASFQSSLYWQQLLERTNELDSQFRVRTGDALLSAASRHRELLTKPFDSFMEKTFRRNVIQNLNFPDEPTNGWLDAGNWYERVTDMVRTSIIVRYLDAVPILTRAIEAYSADAGVECASTLEAREEGYYASHIVITHNVEVPARVTGTERIDAHVEIQVTTQLQDAIRTLLHRFYERSRVAPTIDPTEWKWDHRSEAFAVNYLGHVLHYLEGNIVHVRERERGGTS